MEPTCTTDPDGTKFWYLHGKCHRTNGPAVEYASGAKAWYLNGRCHRMDGPAFESDRMEEWWLNGKRHRMDGPAVEYPSGKKSWYIHGIKLDPSVHPIVEDNKFVNGIPTMEQILDVMLNIDREYGAFLLHVKNSFERKSP